MVSEEIQFASVVVIIVLLYFRTAIPAYAVFICMTASAQGGGSLDIKTAGQSFPCKVDSISSSCSQELLCWRLVSA